MSDKATKEKVGERVKQMLDHVFPPTVETTVNSEGHDLVMVAKWPRPLQGRPNSFASLHVVIAEETIEDCFTKTDDFGCFAVGGMVGPLPTSWELSVEAQGSKPLKTTLRDGEHDRLFLLASRKSSAVSAIKRLSRDTAVAPCP